MHTIKGVKLISAYTKAAELIIGLHQKQPDILLLDVQLPDMKGRDLAIKLLKEYPSLKIVILSGVDSIAYIQNMIKLGCAGYILKSNADRDLLQQSIHEVIKGNLFVDPSIKEELFREMLSNKRKTQNVESKITEREMEVLQLILEEMDNQQIADKLCISIRTVENHRYNLLQKLDVKNTVGLVKIDMELGLQKTKSTSTNNI